MANLFHKDSIDDDNHALTARTYADVAARDADTPFQVTDNINKIVRVNSPLSYYILSSIGPIVWIELSSEGNNEFTELLDTPSTISANLVVQGNSGGTDLEFGQALDTTDNPTFNNLILSGDLTVNGTTTTLNSITLTIDDKNIELGSVATPTDVTADGGGITLKGTTDKTMLWTNSTDSWDFNQAIRTGNLQLSGNTISSFDTNGNIILQTQGTGAVQLIASGGFIINTLLSGTTVNSTFLQINHPLDAANSTGEIRLRERGDLTGENYIGFKAPDVVSVNQIWTLPAADGSSGQILSTSGAGVLSWTSDNGVTDHGALTGLSDDDHTQYALLAGRSGGQTLKGGTVAGNSLTLQSTSSATKGKIFLGANSAYDEVNDRLGIGTITPTFDVDVNGKLRSNRYILGQGPDLSLIPVISGQSVISSWWALQLVGNRQATVDYSPSNVGGISDASVIIPNQQASKIGLIVQGAASQTGNLIEWRNSGGTGLGAIDEIGNLGIGTTSPGQLLSVEGVGIFGIPNVSEALLGMNVNTVGHEGVSLFHDGTEAFLTSVDQGVAWHDLTIEALNVNFDLNGTTNVFRFDSAGRLGIGMGTDALTSPIMIKSSDNRAFDIKSSSTQSGFIIGDSNLTDEWQFIADINGTNALRINHQNSSGNFLDFLKVTHTGTDTGTFTLSDVDFLLEGTSRVKKTLSMHGAQMDGNADTYNGVVCVSASVAVVGSPDMWSCKSYSDGTDNDAAVTTFRLPEDYENGTDIDVFYSYRVLATSGTFHWGLGILVVGDGEDTQASPTFVTGTETPPSTTLFRKTVTATFTGTGFIAGDSVGIVLYRDSSHANDTITDSLRVIDIGIKYTANKLGS